MHLNNIAVKSALCIVVVTLPYVGNAGFSATRHSPSLYDPNSPLSVTINLHFEAGECGGAVVETLPFGWRVSNISGPGAGFWNTNSSTITWAPIETPACGGPSYDQTLGYKLTPPPDAAGPFSITGQFGVDGYVVPVGGDSTLYSRPLVVGFSRSDTNFVMAFTSCSNVLYSVQRSPSLVPPQWVNIGTNLHGSGEIMQAVDEAPGNGTSMFYRIVLQTTAATRLCPAHYRTNGPTPVKITMTLTPEVCQATLTEAPPSGWSIDSISSGGTLVSTQIVWTLNGPACGGSNLYFLTYNATAPAGDTGSKYFGGQFSVNGVTNQILGDTEILPPLANVPNLATRTLPAYYTPGTPLTVTVAISLSPTSCSATATETPPPGWAVSNVQGEGASINPDGIITWISTGPGCGGVSFYQFSYTVTPPVSATGTSVFTGSFSVDGSLWATEGDSSLPIGP